MNNKLIRSATTRLAVTCIWLLQSCAPIEAQQVPKDAYHLADGGEFPIRYQMAGSTGQPLVVFIHGTPGSSLTFAHLLEHPKLQSCCHMIAVDRLGFGESAGSGVQPDFNVQAAAIAEVLRQNQTNRPMLVVGHSLGGSIAVKVAINHADLVGGLLIISSALDPKLSAPRWYHRLADLPLIKHLIPEDLHRANEEMLELKPALAAMTDAWAKLTMPVTIIQGGKDSLVPHKNPEFAEQHLPTSQLKVHRFPQDGHFILWEQPDFIVEQVLKLVHAIDDSAIQSTSNG